MPSAEGPVYKFGPPGAATCEKDPDAALFDVEAAEVAAAAALSVPVALMVNAVALGEMLARMELA